MNKALEVGWVAKQSVYEYIYKFLTNKLLLHTSHVYFYSILLTVWLGLGIKNNMCDEGFKYTSNWIYQFQSHNN